MKPLRLFLLSSNSYLYDPALPMPFDLKSLKMAYITTASKGAPNTAYVERMRTHLSEQNIAYEEVDLDGKTPAELSRILSDKDIVFMEGGNAFYLMNSIRQSGFERVLKEHLQKGLIYMSACAGTQVATPMLALANWRHKDYYSSFGVDDHTAMALVPFLIVGHYNSEQKDLVDEMISGITYPVRTLTDRQAIYVVDGEIKLFGDDL